MNTQIFELSEEEILVISGNQGIDPPKAQADYPEIDNVPPG